MLQPPAGVVTLLFTDIEGSTRLLGRIGPERYAVALDMQRRLLREVVERFDGYEVDSEGDSFFVAFASATDAVAAAVAGQQALRQAAWGDDLEIRVRMGLHTGEPLLAAPKYVGLDVHLAARIMAVAHGGQVLVSASTQRQVGRTCVCDDLGEHRLRDLPQPQRLFQVVVDGSPRRFPALRTLTVGAADLPLHPEELIGRDEELADLLEALARPNVRLLTLTGAGGSGKTRLALRAAAILASTYTGRIVFIPLAAIRDAELVVPVIAQGLAVTEVPGEALLSTLVTYIGEDEMLLVLDNFEQILPAGPILFRLLGACRRLTLLVTSRERLRLIPEQVFDVPPLAVPEEGVGDLESIAAASSVALFVTRARTVEPRFALTNDNAGSVAEICRRLDGLPLAIELAAARSKLMPPATLVARLQPRLQLLTGGPRDAHERQRTLRSTIEWSYELPAPPNGVSSRS